MEVATNPWTMHIGTPHDPVYLSFLWSLAQVEVFVAIDDTGIAAGLAASIGWRIPKQEPSSDSNPPASQPPAAPQPDNDVLDDDTPFLVSIRCDLRLTYTGSHRPALCEGHFELAGEFRLKLLFLRLGLVFAIEGDGRFTNPSDVRLEFRLLLELPWPLPDLDFHGEADFYRDPTPPALYPPLLAGSYVPDDDPHGDPDLPEPIGAVHSLSGKQWHLDSEPIWPDADIVVPFTEPVTDMTGTVVGVPITPRRAGIYELTHTLEQLTITDLDTGVAVSGMSAVWAGSTNGSGGQLHVLASDPFSWFSAQPAAARTSPQPAARRVEQRFGPGGAQPCPPGARFGFVVVNTAGELYDLLDPALATRVLRTESLQLLFETASGLPVEVTDVEVVVLSDVAPNASSPDGVVTASDAGVLDRSRLRMFNLNVSTAAPVNAVRLTIEKSGFLSAAVRFTLAPPDPIGPARRTVLTPGRYRIALNGRSAAATDATDAAGAPAPTPVGSLWQAQQDFTVVRPPTLRPYLATSTLGDDRIFGSTSSWNPTTHGIGFPAYRALRPALRMKSANTAAIFGGFSGRLVCNDGSTFDVPLTLRPLPEGESSLLPTAQAWITAHGGAVPADDEAISMLDLQAAAAGPARLELRVDPAAAQPLESWRCLLSRYPDVAAHLTPAPPVIRRLLTTAGPVDAPSCPPLTSPHVIPPLGDDEFSSPPADWVPPPSILSYIGELDGTAAARFLALADTFGTRLGSVTAVVGDTVIDAVLDGIGRPMALWLLTPEPVDWRRLTVTAQLWHVAPDDGCPTGYAPRRPLALDLDVVPSVDGCAAFLVARLSGVPTCLPRGVLSLHYRYAAAAAGLATVRLPADAPEQLVDYDLTLATGPAWPRPPAGPVSTAAGGRS